MKSKKIQAINKHANMSIDKHCHFICTCTFIQVHVPNESDMHVHVHVKFGDCTP